MKLPETSEWVLHATAVIAQLPPGSTVSGAQLAEHFGVPGPYLQKQLAKLVRAGILTGSTGPRGGFRLARDPEAITLLDLVTAVDGDADPYVCRELRQQGRGAARPEDCRNPCALASAMRAAHEAWRSSLQHATLGGIVAGLPSAVLEKNRRLLLEPRA
ncbi:Rrf2 family transcriptional regulator [Microbacterium sp. 13-71-7]|uniref:RrF2 family transcriptional regulator n=1 Tax=Microbacterium sp. 13-71-7 TaxID=1970399 RepID=UPI000BDCCDD8|nr:Rrf2 family transcriptional regulator [Microbacterium sp. 13-71-7]OZB83118.1 MAG: transcriptional regulator [Microbacterium sp. 13-71-7]